MFIPMPYKKRPVTIYAVRLSVRNFREVIAWCRGAGVQDATLKPIGVDIRTMEGTMRASMGDWIIKGVAGEFYPCKPEIFEKTYELAT